MYLLFVICLLPTDYKHSESITGLCLIPAAISWAHSSCLINLCSPEPWLISISNFIRRGCGYYTRTYTHPIDKHPSACAFVKSKEKIIKRIKTRCSLERCHEVFRRTHPTRWMGVEFWRQDGNLLPSRLGPPVFMQTGEWPGINFSDLCPVGELWLFGSDKKKNFYLFIYGCTGSSLSHGLFSTCGERGATL